jgi:hypothetical protein
MPSLRDHLLRTPEVRSRNLSAAMAPALGERVTPMSPRIIEVAAMTVLAHVVRESGPIREQLLFERRRFERLVHIIHCLPERGGER